MELLMKRQYLKPTSIGVVMLLLLPLLLSGCKESEQTKASAPAMPPPAIDIATVTTQPYTSTVELPGRISPVRVADVRARVAGIVLSRNFEEGADVEKGQILFEIDPAPFEAALAQARASLAQAEASFFQAQAEYNRSEPLNKIGAISPQEFDAATANLKAAQAAKKSALAQIKTAELNLGYATVVAPISGRIGRALVTEGALVGQGEATAMAKIQQLDPIYADFTQPLSDYLRMKSTRTDNDAPVSINLDEIDYTQEGRFLFSDVNVDRTTSQVSLRGEFANPQGLLLPNMFVQVTVEIESFPEAVFIPQRAVTLTSAGNATVFVVDAQGVTTVREIVTGKMKGSEWQIVEGLNAGDQVIVNGVDKIRPGMQLDISAMTNQSTSQIAKK